MEKCPEEYHLFSSLVHLSVKRRKSGTHLQNLTAFRGAVDVLTGLVHPQSDAVQQDHHDADALEPCGWIS